MHLIDVRDVYKIYNPGENQVNALDGVSLTIDEGEFVAIIGQSGSGKSTMMKCLFGTYQKDEDRFYLPRVQPDLLPDRCGECGAAAGIQRYGTPGAARDRRESAGSRGTG